MKEMPTPEELNKMHGEALKLDKMADKKVNSGRAESYQQAIDEKIRHELKEADPIKWKRIKKRAEEMTYYVTQDSSVRYESSMEIEKKIVIPSADETLIEDEIELLSKIPKGQYPTEEMQKRLNEWERQRANDFLSSNQDMFYSVPKEIMDSIDTSREEDTTQQLGFLLSLPYHLQKMRKDGITHIVASATSSIPYCILLKKLDELLYPNEEKIKFIIYSTKLRKEGDKRQDQKIVEYFGKYPNAKIGAFDECASSHANSTYNKRATVTKVKRGIEKTLSVGVIGRYGTDTVFPSIRKGRQITAHSSQNGDEGKGRGLFWMSNLIEEDKIVSSNDGYNSDKLNLFKSTNWENSSPDSIGYERTKHGGSGLRVVEKLERLAKIAYDNFSHNPDSIWNPLNKKIRLGIDYNFKSSEPAEH